MNKKHFILFIIFFIFLFVIPFNYQFSFSKYIFNDAFISAKIRIDKKPELEVLSVSNTNTGYETYANKTHKITLTVKITENNIAINHFNHDYIKFTVNDSNISPSTQISLISHNDDEYIYKIVISNVTGNGRLRVIFPEGLIQDISGQKTGYLNFNTGIIIDNIAPTSNCEELSIENDKSQYIIQANEGLRNLDGWELSDSNTTLSKIFCSSISYPIPITDYAGNVSEVLVDVKNAKNIVLYYANYNNYIITQWDSSGQISGKQAILDGTNYKSEMLVTYIDGDIDNTILQARAFDYTYWGENTRTRCIFSEIPYTYGYSPSATTWYDINSKNKIRFLGKFAFQLGGQGHNTAGISCLGENNPIPQEIADQNLYGLSGIAFRLRDCEEYSIVYQIYVPDIGWLRASSDGEETTYSHDRPFSAIRINIVPKSEKQYLMDYWNRVIYTDYVE